MTKCTCPYCGEVFSSTLASKKFCTRRCKERSKARRLAGKRRAEQTFCENCQGPKGSAKGRFCSRDECRRMSVKASYAASPEGVAAEARRKARGPVEKVPPLQGPRPICRSCGKVLNGLNHRFCGALDCKAAYKTAWREKNKDSVKRTRSAMKAKRRDAYVEHVDVGEVYKRDSWKCGICGKKVDRNLTYPHPRSASLDHVIPLSRGGKHESVNCQLAHLDCNVRKGNRGSGDQLAIF